MKPANRAGRPKGTGKPPERQWRGYHVKMPPELWAQLHTAAPSGELAEWVRAAIREKLARERAE